MSDHGGHGGGGGGAGHSESKFEQAETTAIVSLVQAAAEAAVQESIYRTLVPVIRHGTVTEANTLTWLSKVQMDGDPDSILCHDISQLGCATGSRVTVLFAPPHQGLIIGGPRYATRWQDYNVTWTCPGGSAPSVGNGALNGRYQRAGQNCFFSVVLIFGSTTNGGTSDWVFGLPFQASHDIIEQVVLCKAFTNGLAQNWSGWAFISNSATVARPYFPGSNSNVSLFPARNADAAGTPGTGVPQVTGNFTWTDTRNFIMNGFYRTV